MREYFPPVYSGSWLWAGGTISVKTTQSLKRKVNVSLRCHVTPADLGCQPNAATPSANMSRKSPDESHRKNNLVLDAFCTAAVYRDLRDKRSVYRAA